MQPVRSRPRWRLPNLPAEPALGQVLDWAVLAIGALWGFAVFAGFAWAAFSTSFAIVAEAEPQLSTDTSWLPLAAEVARGNLFPIQPSLGTGASGLAFYPYLTVWIHGLFTAIFGPAGAQAVGQTLWPSVDLLLLWQVYRLYLARRWSLVLAAIGLVVLVPLPFRAFAMALLQGEGWRQVNIAAPLDSVGFPIPSFTLAAFLFCFLLSERRRRLTDARLTLLTALWALQSQVHPVNAVIGLVFWFSRFPQVLHRQRQDWSASRLLRAVVVQLVVALIVALPAIAGWFNALDSYALLGQTREAPAEMFGRYFYFAYTGLPLALMLMLYQIIRIDRYEILARFWPVYLMMIVEFALVSANLWLDIGISAENVVSRLGVYFLHIFYYVPVIHYLTRANAMPPAGNYLGGRESKSLAVSARAAMQWIANEASKVYVPILLVVLTFYAGASMLKVSEFTREVATPRAVEALAAVGTLTDGAREGSLLISDIPGVNLMLPIQGRFGTLWVSRFANRVSTEDVVARLALYARLVGWSESDFLSFMAPDMPRAPVPMSFGRGDVPRGVGYWLAFHRTVIRDRTSLAIHEERMRAVFRGIDLAREITRCGAIRFLSRTPPPADVAVVEIRDTAAGKMYIFKH